MINGQVVGWELCCTRTEVRVGGSVTVSTHSVVCQLARQTAASQPVSRWGGQTTRVLSNQPVKLLARLSFRQFVKEAVPLVRHASNPSLHRSCQLYDAATPIAIPRLSWVSLLFLMGCWQRPLLATLVKAAMRYYHKSSGLIPFPTFHARFKRWALAVSTVLRHMWAPLQWPPQPTSWLLISSRGCANKRGIGYGGCRRCVGSVCTCAHRIPVAVVALRMRAHWARKRNLRGTIRWYHNAALGLMVTQLARHP